MHVMINSFVDVLESGKRPQMECVVKDAEFGELLLRDIKYIQETMCTMDPTRTDFPVEYMQLQAGLNWLQTLNQVRTNLLKKDENNGR